MIKQWFEYFSKTKWCPQQPTTQNWYKVASHHNNMKCSYNNHFTFLLVHTPCVTGPTLYLLVHMILYLFRNHDDQISCCPNEGFIYYFWHHCSVVVVLFSLLVYDPSIHALNLPNSCRVPVIYSPCSCPFLERRSLPASCSKRETAKRRSVTPTSFSFFIEELVGLVFTYLLSIDAPTIHNAAQNDWGWQPMVPSIGVITSSSRLCFMEQGCSPTRSQLSYYHYVPTHDGGWATLVLVIYCCWLRDCGIITSLISDEFAFDWLVIVKDTTSQCSWQPRWCFSRTLLAINFFIKKVLDIRGT